MFKGLGNLASLMRQASQMGGRMQEMTDSLREKRVVGEAGGGMVRIELNGAGEALDVQIDAALIQRGEKDVIEDLLQAAFNQAQSQAKSLHMEAMQDLTGGLSLPGMEDAMAKLFGGAENAAEEGATTQDDRSP